MSNETPKTNGNGTGIGGLLTTLAKGGDKSIQLLIVGGIILNTVLTQHGNKGIANNSKELDQLNQLRTTVAAEVQVIYDNQRAFADFMDETRFGLVKVQDKLGIPHPEITPYPRVEMPYLGPLRSSP